MISNMGGIDLTPSNLNVQVKAGSQTVAPPLAGSATFGDDSIGIKFHLDPAMLTQLQNAPGLVPVIISVEPLGDLRKFLGV